MPNIPGVTATFRAAARETIFQGFLRVYSYKEVGEADDPDEVLNTLPQLPVGLPCQLQKLDSQQCFTQPPARYSEASLVKALEQNGVGRPSTYATIVNTIQTRDYVTKDKGALVPTELGFKICDYLVGRMPDLFNVGFTAHMEDELDNIEEKKVNWVDMLRTFYGQFQGWLGAQALATSPGGGNELVAKILDELEQDVTFDPPVKKGRKTYDDSEFVASIRERIGGGEPLSDRQWGALIGMLGRYAPRSPKLQVFIEENGLTAHVQEHVDAIAERDARPKTPVSPESLALLEAMKDVKFQPAVKRG
ncbi:MAG: hypothetical protein IJJ26_02515 [Victivallales bacterium]|nr:hypothetical protein [Victivallales bacterium]